jgi:hypothetical protein
MLLDQRGDLGKESDTGAVNAGDPLDIIGNRNKMM